MRSDKTKLFIVLERSNFRKLQKAMIESLKCRFSVSALVDRGNSDMVFSIYPDD